MPYLTNATLSIRTEITQRNCYDGAQAGFGGPAHLDVGTSTMVFNHSPRHFLCFASFPYSFSRGTSAFSVLLHVDAAYHRLLQSETGGLWYNWICPPVRSDSRTLWARSSIWQQGMWTWSASASPTPWAGGVFHAAAGYFTPLITERWLYAVGVCEECVSVAVYTRYLQIEPCRPTDSADSALYKVEYKKWIPLVLYHPGFNANKFMH